MLSALTKRQRLKSQVSMHFAGRCMAIGKRDAGISECTEAVFLRSAVEWIDGFANYFLVER